MLSVSWYSTKRSLKINVSSKTGILSNDSKKNMHTPWTVFVEAAVGLEVIFLYTILLVSFTINCAVGNTSSTY